MNGRSARVRKRRFIRDLACFLAAGVVMAVSPRVVMAEDDMSHFDVVSVKLNLERTDGFGSDFGKCIGGPGTQSPTVWICHRINVVFLLNNAFGLEVYQFNTRPDWMVGEILSVSARLPANTTRAQFREMLRNILAERFGLIWHWKEADGTVYRLLRDPGGVKLHESAPDADPAIADYGGRPAGVTVGKDLYPILPEGVSALVGLGNHNRWRSSNVTTADIAHVLRWELRSEVVDETELTGHYDVDLRWETPPIEYFPSAPPYEGPDAKTSFGRSWDFASRRRRER